ncbi:hypothetical protein DUNSADRAFT_1427 [Dunaliella salina]|uniref:CBM20 domain-containing protein n=1 Tax=Dunaliella salina TaxID=3046 RepID=A0ABQ7FXH4_DUNSA|nr:hypothetical protein DUNSADRAFT_1427 [Dunaliella salina]|eukprot:KAF5827058.1 hypothetical protein DUNSADRAFT_1427 [Dunaliella salina]
MNQSLHKAPFRACGSWSHQGRPFCQLPHPTTYIFRRRLAASQASSETTTSPSVEAPSNCVLANFSVQGKVAFGEWLRLVGSSDEFGRWGPLEGPLLRWNEGDVWKASIPLPCDLDKLEFKVVVCHENGGNPRWEPVPNRILEVPNEPGILDHSCVWGSMDGSTSSFTPSFAGSQEHELQESPTPPTVMSALPSLGTVEPAQAPGTEEPAHASPISLHVSHEEPSAQGDPQLTPSAASSTPSAAQPSTLSAAQSTPSAAPSTPSTSLQDTTSTSEPSSSNEGKFNLFGLAATALAAVLLVVALGEVSTSVDKQRKATASPSPQEQVLSKS